MSTYGGAHQAERRRHAPTVKAGRAYCTERICLKPNRWIAPGTPWDLAHDRVNGGYLGPAHASCNRGEGGRYARARERHTKRATLARSTSLRF